LGFQQKSEKSEAEAISRFVSELAVRHIGSTSSANQAAMVAQQQKQSEALTAGLENVRAQVEMSRRAPQVVSNRH
jgi:hypothetical protein